MSSMFVQRHALTVSMVHDLCLCPHPSLRVSFSKDRNCRCLLIVFERTIASREGAKTVVAARNKVCVVEKPRLCALIGG